MPAFGALKSITVMKTFIPFLIYLFMSSCNATVWIPIPTNISFVRYFERFNTILEKRPSCLYGTQSLGRLNSLWMAFIITLRLVNCWLKCLVRLKCLGGHLLCSRLIPWKKERTIWRSLICTGWRIVKFETKNHSPPPLQKHKAVEKLHVSDEDMCNSGTYNLSKCIWLK